MNGPGALATDNHGSLVGRLAAIIAARGLTYTEKAIVGQTPYKQPFTVDLLVSGIAGCPDGLGVVGRYQATSGSADQKLVFLAFCIRRSGVPCVVVLDGGGWPDGAIEWLAGQRAGRLLDLFTVEAFEDFLAGALAAD